VKTYRTEGGVGTDKTMCPAGAEKRVCPRSSYCRLGRDPRALPLSSRRSKTPVQATVYVGSWSRCMTEVDQTKNSNNRLFLRSVFNSEPYRGEAVFNKDYNRGEEGFNRDTHRGVSVFVREYDRRESVFNSDPFRRSSVFQRNSHLPRNENVFPKTSRAPVVFSRSSPTPLPSKMTLPPNKLSFPPSKVTLSPWLSPLPEFEAQDFTSPPPSLGTGTREVLCRGPGDGVLPFRRSMDGSRAALVPAD